MKYLFIFSLFYMGIVGAEDAPKVVEVVQVTKSSIKEIVHLHGVVKSKKQGPIRAQKSGRVSFVDPKDIVKKGDIVIELAKDKTLKHLKLSEEKESLAKRELARAKRLLDTGAIAQARYDSAHEKWLKTREDLNDMEELVEKHVYRAPFDGYCGMVDVNEGEFVKENDIMLTCYDPESLYVEAGVPGHMVDQMMAGQKALMGDMEGNVRYVQHTVDPKTRMGKVHVAFSTWKSAPGRHVQLAVAVKEKLEVLVVPYQSVFIEKGSPHVYKIQENKTVLTPVKTGIQSGETIEIVDGLNLGDQIVLRGQMSLWPGREVTVQL